MEPQNGKDTPICSLHILVKTIPLNIDEQQKRHRYQAIGSKYTRGNNIGTKRMSENS